MKIIRRTTLEVVGSFAAGGGHGLTTDREGNLYTAGREKHTLTGYVKAPKKAASSAR